MVLMPRIISFTFAGMMFCEKHFSVLSFLLIIISYSYSQNMPVRKDSAALYMIVTLNDGTVLKGKILNKVRRRTEFRDELLGNVTFYSKDVASMEELQPQEHYLITMMNGTTVQGKIVERKGGILVFETSEIGNVYIDISLIKTIRCIIPGKMRDGKYWFKTAVDAHYFIALSAIPLKPSEVFYQNSLLLFNSFDAGITKNFSCNSQTGSATA